MIPSLDLGREQCKQLVLVQRDNMNINFNFHSPIEICYVQKGALEVLINDQQTILYPGELSVALSYDAHCYHTVGDSSEALVMIIPTSMCMDFLAVIEKQRAINPFIRDKKATAKIMEYYAELKSDQSNKIKEIGYTNVILGIIMENVGFEAAMTEMNTHLSSRILMYINENYKDSITNASIAARFGYNPSYLSRYFKSCFHIGINQYVTLVRLKQFVILSNNSKKSVADCAYECGFSSLRTFYRAFYNEFKCTPKEFIP